MLSSWRELGQFVFGKQSGGHKRKKHDRSERLEAATRCVLESLENRQHLSITLPTTPAVLPKPTVTAPVDISGGAADTRHNTASVAYNPLNPLELVSVWVFHNEGANGTQKVFVQGAFSTDGGANWSNLGMPGNLVNPQTVANNPQVYARATDPAVAFDRAGNFYVTYLEHTDDPANPTAGSGAIVLQSFDFNGNTPNAIVSDSIVYQWAGADAAQTPMLAVDNNLDTFADPETGFEQNDPFVGNIYVAWSSSFTPPTNPPGNFNPNSIIIVASTDGGATFSGQFYVNDNGNAGHRMSTPRLVVSQGTPVDPNDPTAINRVTPGQVTIVWDDFTGANGRDILLSDRIRDGAALANFDGPVGPIADATLNPVQGQPDVPAITEFTIDVNIADPNFTVSDVDLPIVLTHSDLTGLAVELEAPDGTIVRLFSNRVDGAGAVLPGNPAPGIAGANLGTLNGNDVGTVFDSQAVRSLRDASVTAPFIGHFRPLDSLNAFNGLTSTDLNGPWILRITDVRNGPAPTPPNGPPEVVSWSLHLTSGMTTEADRTIATTQVRGALVSPFPLQPAVSPDRGIGPAVSIASDNTLGSFSPYQGRLYATFVGKGSNANDNTDVFLATSDDGGRSWQLRAGGVNDDRLGLDGFSAGNRPQFEPEVAVDQGTGTLVLSFLDARHDPAHARVATYLATSLDGGLTFGPQTYANQPNAALDVIEGRTVNIEPIPDNMSAVNGSRDQDFGMGDRQGLVVANGRINAVWASNLNGAHLLNGGNRDDSSFHIFGAVANIAAGPRVRDSEMGPVTSQQNLSSFLSPNSLVYDALRSPDGTTMLDGFVVVFDRPIDPASFGPEDVTLIYRDVHTLGSDPGTAIEIDSIEPFDLDFYGPALAEGATTFLVHLLNPQSAVGTYSYTIGPDINDRIRHVASEIVPNTQTQFDASGTSINLRIPPAGTGGSGNPNNDLTTSTLDVSGLTPGDVISDVNVIVSLTHTYDSDLIITLVSPLGTRVVLSNRRGSFGDDFDNTIFDDQALLPIAFGAAPFDSDFRPDQPLARLLGQDPNGTWTLEISDEAAIDIGDLLAWSLQITTGTLVTVVQDGNSMDQNSDSTPGQAPSPGSMGDIYSAPKPVNDTAFNGEFVAPPFDRNTRPLIIPGPHIVQTQISQQFIATGNQTNLPVPAVGDGGSGDDTQDVTLSTITINQPGVLITDLNINLTLTHPANSDLTVWLITPDGTEILLALNEAGSNFINTTFDDDSLTPIFQGVDPFTGSFRSEDGTTFFGGLEGLVGTPLSGTWTLKIKDDIAGDAGTLVGWSLINGTTGDNLALNRKVDSLDLVFDRDMDPTSITPASILRLMGPIGAINGPFTITANPLGTDVDPLHPRIYRVGFPLQRLSGTYSFLLSPTIRSATGDQLDSNLDAGNDMLGDVSTTFNATTFRNTTRATIGGGAANKVTASTIDVPDSFPISGLTVQLNITYPFDPDLVAVLIAPFNDPTTGQPFTVKLFSNVGNAGTKRDFVNTIFDDNGDTPIQNGGGPFFGRYNPELPLSALDDQLSGGVWTLQITDTAANRSGTLNNWSLTFQKPVPLTGLGDPVVDQATASFRIFTMDPTNPQSHDTWTPVGGASNNAQGNSSRIGGLAVDPSDASGNTVYVAGASGGVWKTTNFMTSDLSGPIWLPLTDFAPTFGLNIGGIAIFGRNHDTNQSVVFVATGEGDTGSPGVGFLRSMDGGATWNLLDSTVNVDAQGNLLPINSPLRDHIFFGTAGFDVVVDPHPTPTGDVIVYAALTGANGGVWRSVDTGNHWQRMRAGDATDIALDQNSGYFDVFSNPTGNLQYIYAGFRGEGVFLSPNRGQLWNQLLGGVGDPLIQDNTGRPTAVPVDAPSNTPNGAKGRIVLANPALTGDPLRDLQYQGFLYALVVNSNDHVDGLYLTKDFGQNWTRVRLSTVPANGRPITGIATNDTTQPDYDMGGGGDFAQGNYDIAIGIDPNNPNIVYLGGTADGQGTGLIRVDTSGVSDPHGFFVSNSRMDGGQLFRQITDSMTVSQGNPFPSAASLFPNPWFNPMVNLIRDPSAPFVAASTVQVINAARFSNSGAGATWTPFDIEGTDHHRWVTMVDPVTGLTRLIVGDDQGLYTAVDSDGEFSLGIGLTGYGFTDFSRNGNLQISQFYYGAAQPSNLAAQIAGAMFYGQAQDNGSLMSGPTVLDDGTIIWSGPEGDGAGVATDQRGTGTVYMYNWPCCGGDLTNFFQVNGVGRTFGLLQDSQPGNTPDPQWPFLGGSTFAVNPLDGNQVIMSSQAGRIFGTSNQGIAWFVIGDPAALDSTYAPALAYGAPDPNGPGGGDATNFFIYAGTSGGRIFVTFNGGGAAGNNWRDISAGLDGSGVQMIVTDPLRGSHDAYAVTSRGVYFLADSTAATPTWVNISGNLFNLNINAFGDPNFASRRMAGVSSIAADWRYFFPDTSAANSPTHPVLFVGGEGGVYRSLDKGKTWHLFPDPTIDGATYAGGLLPNAHVTDLDLALGNIDPTTGQPDVSTGPDVLLATTYGRSSFAIRMAPIILPGSVRIDAADDSGISNSDLITNIATMRFSGISAPTAFGNTVRITLLDLTDPNNPVRIGGYDGTPGSDIPANWTDITGKFSLRINAGVFNTDGLKTIGVHASDESGTTSHDTILSFTLDTTNPVGISQTIAAVEGSAFTGAVAIYPNEPAIGSASINWGDGSTTNGTIVANPGGGFAVRGTHTYGTPGAWVIVVSATDAAGNPGVTNSSANVSNPAVVATGGFTFSAKQNTPSAVQTVATFTDPGGPDALTDYTASIDWGDGSSPSVGTITLNNTTFTVRGSHTYATSASFPITVTITHSTNSVAALNAVVTSTAVVALPDLVGTGAFVIAGSEGTASGNVVVATFTDPGPAQLIGAYAALITWGDGTAPSAGTITLNAGVYSVVGNHTYSIPGNFTISTDLTRTTSTITVQSSANIANPAVVATGGFAFAGAKLVTSPVQTLATFTDPGGPEVVGAYVATITWGDGGPTSIGTITNNSGVYTVSGSHKYANTGTFTITVTITHTQNGVDAPNSVVTSPATILLPAVNMTGGFTFIAAEGTSSSSQTVAKFTDPSGAGPEGSYTALIDWGDNTTSIGVITLAPASGEFTAKQSHQYAEEGSYPIHITIERTGSLDASTNSTATVSDVPVAATGGFVVNAFRGVQSASQTVATFTDPAGFEPLGEYGAMINWGDGRTSAGVISFNPVGQVFTVKGDHLYNAEGLFTISVTLQHGTAQNRSAISSANVVHPPLVVTGGLTYAAVEGKLMTLPVATFTDPVQGSEAVSNYSATVSWGDGTNDVTGVTGRVFITVDTATGIFTVHGTHTYSEEANRTITISVRYKTEPYSTVTSNAVIADPAVIVTGGLTVNGTEAQMFTNKTVATFTDPGGVEPSTDYSAMINWGDGNSSAGVITFNATTKVFSVAGDHRYNDGGNYTITTTVLHDTAPDASATSSAHIIDAPVNATGGFTFTAVEGALSGVQTVATFVDVGVPKATSAYTVEIEWGDQSPSTVGTLSFNAGTGVFTVRGQHLYASKGTFTIHVTISHGTAQEKTVSSTANVANAPVTVTPSSSLPSINEGVSFTGNLGAFVDANPASVASMFTVSIDWGDGQTSAGTITVDPTNSQRYVVSGTHTWGDGTSTKTITIKVRDAAAGEDIAPKTTSIQVLNVKPSVSIEEPDSTVFRGFNANFSLSGFDAATDEAAGFTYTINWGDGSAVQTIARAAGNADRTVGHTFNTLNTSHVTVRATDKDGAISDIATLDVLPEAPPVLDSSSVNSGLRMRSRIMDIEFALSADAALALSDLKLMRSGVAVSLAAAGFSYDAGTATAHLDMRHVKLGNANYSLLIDTGAGTLHVDFYKLAGDTNGDRKVNKSDVRMVTRSLNKRLGQAGYRANGDVNGNNKVDKKDLKVVKTNLKRKLPRP